jgi:hypothetical protein
MPLTDDPNDPRLTHGSDEQPVPMAEVYLVLSDEERAKNFVRPLRRSYVHVGYGGTEGTRVDPGCGVQTHMGLALCETYARQPSFYGSTYCAGCKMHRSVDEFVWAEDGQVVGS